jgi:hypothetical protein
MTKSATLTNSTVIEYVNITNVTLIFHNLNSGLNYTSIYGTRGGYALSLNAGTMMNGGQGYQLNSNQTIISVEYKTGGFVPEGTGFMVWLDRYIGLNNNGTSILGLRFKAPNYAYTGPLDVIVNYVDGESTTPISTTTIPYSYLSHPICSPTNNTFYSYPDNITCPSACPYTSTQYYQGYGPTGMPFVGVTNIGTHVCLYSPFTASITSTIPTTSTTTIPQTKYYHIIIIQKPNLALEANSGQVYCNYGGSYLYPIGVNLTEVVGHYYSPEVIENPSSNEVFLNGSIVEIKAPSACNYNNTLYNFTGWFGVGDGSISSNASAINITVMGNITEIANYKPVLRYGTYQNNTSTTTTTSTTSTTTSSSTTTIQPAKPVYYSLYVKSMSNSGSVSQSGNGTYVAGSRVLISARPPKGEVFGSWFCLLGDAPTTGEMGIVCNNNEGYSGSSQNITITLNSNITEIAMWATPQSPPLNRSLTITSDPSGIGAQGVILYQHSMRLVQELPNTTTYSNNASINISVTNVPPGWQFTGWSCGGVGCYSGNARGFNLSMDNNITETENFAPIYYTLNEKIVSPDNCGSVSQSGNGTYVAGSIVHISATPTPGCDFKEWGSNYGGGYSGSSLNATITMNSNITETAYWSYSPPEVTMTVNVTPYTININQSLIGGYAEIYDKYALYGPYGATTCFTSNATTTGWSGEQNTCPMMMTQGDPVTISAVPYPGWKFNGWTGSSYTGMSQSINISGASSIETAHFIPVKTYYLTINGSACGGGPWPFCTSPNSGSYSFFPGYRININAISGFNEGNSIYDFANWSGSGIGSYTGQNRSIDITMNSNITETANYKDKECYTLTLLGNGGTESANPASSGGCSQNQYVYGTSVSITAAGSNINSYEGYMFKNWSGLGIGSVNSTNLPLNIKMVGNITEIAHYYIGNYT